MNDKGFTLIELLVVFSIIIVLSIIIFSNYRGGQEQFALQRSTYRLGQDIRKAQELAMSAQEFLGDVPQTGYGIVFDTNWDTAKYRLYIDTADSDEFFTDGDSVKETVELEEKVYIKQIYIASGSRSKGCVNFKPPDPIIKIKYNIGSDANEMIVTLGLTTDASKEKTIFINKAGLISID